jgi:hypothetical protein
MAWVHAEKVSLFLLFLLPLLLFFAAPWRRFCKGWNQNQRSSFLPSFLFFLGGHRNNNNTGITRDKDVSVISFFLTSRHLGGDG